MGTTPALVSDHDLRAELDRDFVSFGGPESNFKSEDVNRDPGNKLARFDQGQNLFTRFPGGQLLAKLEDLVEFDYGLILKIHPKQFPQRVWIMCAGLGEWGTSGASWYLANRWREIEKRAGDAPFAVVVRVRRGQDQSAEQIAFE